MIRLRALKSFSGARGESVHPDNMIRRGDIFTTDSKLRADELMRNKLVEAVDGVLVGRSNKAKPKPLSKPKPASEQKSKAARRPLSDAEKAERAAKSKATKAANKAGRTGAGEQSSLSGQGQAPASTASDLPSQSEGTKSEGQQPDLLS